MPGLKTNEVKLVSENGLQQKSITIDNNGIPLFNGIQIPTVSSPTINSPTISSPTFTGVANFASGGLNVGSGQLVVDSSGRVLMPYQPVYQGRFGNYAVSTSNYNPTLETSISQGFTVNTSTSRLTALVPGKYYVYCQQLVSTAATAVYLHIRKNGSSIAHGYSNADETYDIITACIVDLAVNDYIDFYYGGTTTYAWGGLHTSVCCHLIG